MMADNAQNKLCLSVAPKKLFKANLPAKVRPCLVLYMILKQCLHCSLPNMFL